MLLFVFLTAACAAIALYIELPKAAFEAQRTKEQTLIDRGLEYRRAIQLYVRDQKKYPANLDGLEKTNNKRYLRRRYIDPMTGKDEWRVINIGPNGEFTNSLVHKQKTQDGERKYNNTFISESPGLGETASGTGPGANTLANRQRPSDLQGAPGQGAPGPPGDPNQPQTYGQAQQQQQLFGQQQPNPYQQQPSPFQQVPNPYQQQQPNPYQVQPGQPMSAYPTAQGYQQQPVGFPPNPAQPNPAAFGTTPQGVASSQTGGVVPQQIGYGQPTPYGQPQQPNPYGQQNPYTQTPITQTNPQIANQIMDMITRPRQPNAPTQQLPNQNSGFSSNPGFGSFGNQQGSSTASPTSTMGGFGAGIAGVASKYEAEGIMVFGDRTKYNEWEFLYDSKRDSRMVGSAVGTQGAQGLSNPGNTVGTGSSFNNPGSSGSGLGSQSPFPSQGGFGPQGGSGMGTIRR